MTIKYNNQGGINVIISIANQNCMMPDFIGTLSKISANKFSGYVRIDPEDQLHQISIEFKGNSAEVSSSETWEQWRLGAACQVTGEYQK